MGSTVVALAARQLAATGASEADLMDVLRQVIEESLTPIVKYHRQQVRRAAALHCLVPAVVVLQAVVSGGVLMPARV